MTIRKASVFSFSLLLLTMFGSPSIAQNSTTSDELITVDGQSVDKDEFIYLMGKGSNGSPGLSRKDFEENLELFINYKLKVREAEALGLHESFEFRQEFEAFKENLKAPFLIKNSLEEGELRKSYARMQEVIRASHILFQFPPNASSEDSLIVLKMALKVRQEILAGGDINALAVEYSDDPSARTNQGDLGYFTSLQMVQPFEDAAYGLKPGDVSEPILTSFGYHIIKVQERKPNPGQVKVSHILVRVNQDNPNSEDQAKRKVADIYTEIQKPTTVWEDIVKNYSEDPATNQKGGLLPWFSVGNMIPDFENTAFALTEAGEVSPPIKTRYGYHILRLEDRKPLDSFEQMEDQIRSRILRESRSTMIQSQVLAIQKSRYGFKENDPLVSRLQNELYQIPKEQFQNQINQLGLSGDEELFKIKSTDYKISDFIDFLAWDEANPKPKNQGYFEFWYDRYLGFLLDQKEEEDLESSNKEYQMLLKEYRDGILLFSLMNEKVWQKGIQDSLGQRRYYEQHIDNYRWEERMPALIVKVLENDKLENAKSALSNQQYSEAFVEEFTEQARQNTPLAYRIESGKLEIREHPILSLSNATPGFEELTIEGERYLLLKGETIPAGPKKFEETRGQVIKDYQEHLDKQLLENLRSKYAVQINKTAIEEAFVAINQ
ncbi:peptidyl-prolyl cis-trans isomerase SurA [Algoriphagus faecimaris]|uniref:Peptidyl-prolyl cis-trans isomerase SurA n=1 Tax=Algoriphagus faecimaris TaxID=686796 RepID=A0A1G6R1E3_9BACT|nr:peptidylprolyl isomerase [Algoriphagus faecimaris]SDC98480.1 peptidyl-prolyl cis-trans isomerase SurA [Algoriphagus faecimaris]